MRDPLQDFVVRIWQNSLDSAILVKDCTEIMQASTVFNKRVIELKRRTMIDCRQ